jgi:hypothetical protein
VAHGDGRLTPGAQVETPLVYDVSVGTEPDAILLRQIQSAPASNYLCGTWHRQLIPSPVTPASC